MECDDGSLRGGLIKGGLRCACLHNGCKNIKFHLENTLNVNVMHTILKYLSTDIRNRHGSSVNESALGFQAVPSSTPKFGKMFHCDLIMKT